MRGYIKLALRNLLRYKRRTILTGSGIFIGCLMLILNQSYGAGIERQLIFNMIASDTGHIRVTGKTGPKGSDFEEVYAKSKPLIPNPAPIEALLRRQSGIKTINKQVQLTGMISDGFKMKSGTIIGIEPEKESDLWRHVIPAKTGRPLVPQDWDGIYINRSAAKIFQTAVGEILTLMVQTKDGAYNALDFTVVGIFEDDVAAVGAGTMYILLATAQELANLGNGVNQIKIYLNDPGMALQMTAGLSKTIASSINVDIQDWKTAGGFFYGTVLASQIFGNILCLVLFIVIAASIVNTMLMAVYGRTREIGTMMAMGTKRRQILVLFTVEALILGTIAAGTGALLGSVCVWLLNKTGIPAFTESMKYAFGGDRVYPFLTLKSLLLSSATIILLTVLAAFYPSWSAARLKPVEALHHMN